jgi:protein-S-isoprenylcysteine O-methyltransferase Ste14
MMIGGLTLRYLAAKTLGEFYTRTLLVTPEQQVIEQGLYRVVRHPGYLGILIASVGAGLATANWIVIVTIMVTKFIGLGYRIYSEEEMLKAEFGDKYRAYMENTWRLIPFIF